MKYVKTALMLAVVLTVAFVIAPDYDSDADVEFTGNPTSHFDTLSGGSITVPISSSYSDSFNVTVTVTEGSKTVTTVVKQISRDTESIVIDLPNFKSEGTHSLTLTFETENPHDYSFAMDSLNVTVNVESNVFSHWTTYLVIIIAVIAIIAVVYLRMRDTPKKENTMTFEQLEAERKAEMAAKSEKKSQKLATSPSTERKKYTGKKKD